MREGVAPTILERIYMGVFCSFRTKHEPWKKWHEGAHSSYHLLIRKLALSLTFAYCFYIALLPCLSCSSFVLQFPIVFPFFFEETLILLFNCTYLPLCRIPRTIGEAIPMKATFFITYVMVDGWAGVAGEILRLKPLIIFHLKNFFLVKTEKDREEAMDPGSIGFDSNEPQIQLYFLLGLVYAVVTPFLLPFILIFFGLAYVVYRHQVITLWNTLWFLALCD